MKRFIFVLLCFFSLQVFAQGACKSRGDLDTQYCDQNGDLVADTPTDPKLLKTPSTIVFTYTPVEDPAVYEKIFKPFTDYLGQCTAKKVVFYQVQSNAACAFIGDSPNDVPMFAYFNNSFGVANVLNYQNQMTVMPKWVTSKSGSLGFAEFAQFLIENRA